MVAHAEARPPRRRLVFRGERTLHVVDNPVSVRRQTERSQGADDPGEVGQDHRQRIERQERQQNAAAELRASAHSSADSRLGRSAAFLAPSGRRALIKDFFVVLRWSWAPSKQCARSFDLIGRERHSQGFLSRSRRRRHSLRRRSRRPPRAPRGFVDRRGSRWHRRDPHAAVSRRSRFKVWTASNPSNSG